MTSVKVKFRPSANASAEGALYFQLIHRRTIRQIPSGHKVFPTEWDGRSERIVRPKGISKERRDYLAIVERHVSEYLLRIHKAIARLERTGRAYTVEQVTELSRTQASCHNLLSYGRQLIMELTLAGKRRTAETYSTTLNSLARFREGHGDIPLDEMTANMMMAYETWMRDRGICPNSTSYYMRNLRAIYNRAVDQGLAEQQNPFRHVYTGIDKTVKRAVPLKCVRQIRDLKLTRYMAFARDIFMFSFYTRGMSFIDIAYLKKTDMRNGILSYRRKKTNQLLMIKWEKPMQEIIDRYDTSGSPYLLPIIKDPSADTRRQYRSAEHRVNNNLKKIGACLGLSIPLTTYVARHGWASIAKSKNIPLATISEAMGHDSEETTRIYLASLDTSIVDKANSIILKSLL